MPESASNRRTQSRLAAAIRIRVQGIDSAGRAYADSTTALDVSRRGICFRVERELTVLSPVSVVIPGPGPRANVEPHFFTEATVVRSIQETADSYRVAVRLMGATLPMYSSENV